MNYIEQALRTKSDQFHGELISGAVLAHTMKYAIQALMNLDVLKKGLFYGKMPESLQDSEVFKHWNTSFKCNALPFENITIDKQDSIDLIHAIIGKATEAGEGLEALFAALFNNEQFDKVNYIEEVGDGFWYDAIGLDAVGGTFEESQLKNISKLKSRYPEKFTSAKAIDRDLVAERETLESNSTLQTMIMDQNGEIEG